MSLDLPLLMSRSRLLGSVASSAPRLLNMITKPDNLSRRTRSFHLSCLDQHIVRVYVQTLCIFPFPDQNNAEAAIHSLEHGLRLTLKKFPFLAGMLTLPDPKTGKLTLEYPTEVSDEELKCIFRSKQITYHERDFPYTYVQLKRDGMPPSAFKGAMFVPEDLSEYPGVPQDGEGKVDFEKSDAPAMRCQAFFIPGGLVLSTYMHHSVSDFSGINIFWEAFSANVSSLSSQHLACESRIFDTTSVAERQSQLRQAVDRHMIPQQLGSNADCYCDGPPKYHKTLSTETTCTQRLFVIPASRIRQYRDRLRPHFPHEHTPTMCNVLAALVWTHITRARGHRLLGHGLRETSLGIATDLRKRQNPRVPADYMGNMALFSKGTFDVSDMLAEDRVTVSTIVRVIKEIQSTISSVDDEWISRHLKFFKSIDQITDTEISLALTFGSDLYISSWLNFGADLSWGIPGTDQGKQSLAGRPEFIRRTYAPSDGGIIFLPRRRQPANHAEAPFEILVRLAKEDMTRVLDEEGGLRSWADAVLE